MKEAGNKSMTAMHHGFRVAPGRRHVQAPVITHCKKPPRHLWAISLAPRGLFLPCAYCMAITAGLLTRVRSSFI